jgi:hypothetical protein
MYDNRLIISQFQVLVLLVRLSKSYLLITCYVCFRIHNIYTYIIIFIHMRSLHCEITKQGCFCVYKEKNNESTEDYSIFLANIVIPRSNIDVSIHSISMYFHILYFLFKCWCSHLYTYHRLIFICVIYICIYNSFTSYPQILTTLLQLCLWKDRLWIATVWCPMHYTSCSMTVRYRIWTAKYLRSRPC